MICASKAVVVTHVFEGINNAEACHEMSRIFFFILVFLFLLGFIILSDSAQIVLQSSRHDRAHVTLPPAQPKQNSKLQLWLHAFIQEKKKTEKGTVETKEMNHHRQFIMGDGGGEYALNPFLLSLERSKWYIQQQAKRARAGYLFGSTHPDRPTRRSLTTSHEKRRLPGRRGDGDGAGAGGVRAAVAVVGGGLGVAEAAQDVGLLGGESGGGERGGPAVARGAADGRAALGPDVRLAAHEEDDDLARARTQPRQRVPALGETAAAAAGLCASTN
jgi:hypothetical protein